MSTPRSSFPHRSGSVLSAVLIAAAALSAAGALVYTHVATTTTTSEEHLVLTKARKRATPADGRVWLVRAGLDPKALAAVGYAPVQVGTLVASAADYITSNLDEMETSSNAVAATRATIHSLEKKITGGMTAEGDVTALAAARATLASQQEVLDAHLTGILTGGTGEQSNGSHASVLAAIKHNRTKGTGLEFTVEDRTESQWIALRDALASKRIHERKGQEVPGSVEAIITAATSNAVSTAAGHLTTDNIAAVTTAWNTAVAAIGGG